MEEIDNAHILCLIYKFLSSSRDCDGISNGFHRSIDAREGELTNNILTKCNYDVRIYRKDFCSFAEHQDKGSNGLGFKLTLQGNSTNHILSHHAEANDAANLALAGSVIIDEISLYVAH